MGEMISSIERQRLERAGTLHWFHWVVVLLSLVLTFSAWFISKSQLDEKRAFQFAREADQTVELILERMRKYEDALWSGVAFIQARGGDVEYDEWAKYAESIGIEVKYPGINGIGVIHAVKEDGLANYLTQMKKIRPAYQIHPEHDGHEYYPISYIEPVHGNEKAVGLDMAHENNRFTAAKKARDTGDAQITGPITLVQDSGQTPGFLFFAPFYMGGTYASLEARQINFTGLVYAPFVVKKLMEGVLAKQKRSVGLRIKDGQEVLYDEHVISEEDFDPDPLFIQKVETSLYGRTWTFDIWSARSFRDATSNHQPTMVLIGGLMIDGLLVALFIFISRTSRRALVYADAANRELVEKAARLEESNQDLEHFAYVASHDLQEPLRMVGSFSELIERNYHGKLDEKGQEWLGFMINGAQRMQVLVKDLLAYSQVGREDFKTEWVDIQMLVDKVCEDLSKISVENNAEISTDPLPKIKGNESQLRLVFQNLIANAIKFHKPNELPKIHIGVRNTEKEYTFSIKDNGIGIDPAFSERIFVIFQRLHGVGQYTGTGLGLAICKKIVERHGGRIWVESVEGEGSTFSFTLKDV